METIYRKEVSISEYFPADKTKKYFAFHKVHEQKTIGILFYQGISWNLRIDDSQSALSETDPVKSIYWLEEIKPEKAIEGDITKKDFEKLIDERTFGCVMGTKENVVNAFFSLAQQMCAAKERDLQAYKSSNANNNILIEQLREIVKEKEKEIEWWKEQVIQKCNAYEDLNSLYEELDKKNKEYISIIQKQESKLSKSKTNNHAR